MIYDTGDTHALQCKWVKEIHPILKSGDILIVNGDFGIGFWDGEYCSEEMFYDWIAQQSYTVLFIDGNHENFDKLDQYPAQFWNGGKVHKIRHNLIHLMRGEVYEIEKKTIFVFGGGYSVDRCCRIEHVSWWNREMPNHEEYQNAIKNLKQVNYQVDYIITHTAPLETVFYLSSYRNLHIKKMVEKELPLNTFLDEIQRKVNYKQWYFGHFHVDKELWRDQIAVLSCIRELDSGKIVKQWKSYEGNFC